MGLELLSAHKDKSLLSVFFRKQVANRSKNFGESNRNDNRNRRDKFG